MGGQFSSSDSRRAARLAQWVTWLSRGSPAVSSSDEQASDGDNEGSRKKHVYWEGWLTCSTSLAVESILAMTMLSWSCTLHKIRDIHSNIHGGLTTASKSGEQVKKNSRQLKPKHLPTVYDTYRIRINSLDPDPYQKGCIRICIPFKNIKTEICSNWAKKYFFLHLLYNFIYWKFIALKTEDGFLTVKFKMVICNFFIMKHGKRASSSNF